MSSISKRSTFENTGALFPLKDAKPSHNKSTHFGKAVGNKESQVLL
jgi:hypothetical protein